MDKPLARDKNDQDLDAHLKNIERSEDPMLKYMQKQKKKTNSNLPRKYRLFFLISIVQFFTQIYTNCFVSS